MPQDDDLRRLTRMIRTGLDHEGNAEQLAGEVTDAIAKAEAAYPSVPPARLVEDVKRLRLCTLKAESQYQSGHYQDAVETLAPIWNVLKPRLDRTPTIPLQPQGYANAALLRQQLWALLHYVFYKYYTIDGHQGEAITAFRRINQVILVELADKQTTPPYTPSGTLGICDYFIGQAYRAQRNFPQAEAHFLAAQKHIQDRIDRKLKEMRDGKPVDMEAEIAFKNVFSARVMSGLSWLAMQEGRLTRAEHFLRTALTILVDTHQESIKRFITTILWICILRRARLDSDTHSDGLKELDRLFHKYLDMDDLAGQYRCAGELARGYLDLADFHPIDKIAAKRPFFESAGTWLAILGRAADPRHTVHYHLLTARYCLLTGKITEAEAHASEARSCAKTYFMSDEHSVEISIMSALCYRYRAQQELDEAAMEAFFKRAEGRIDQGVEDIRAGTLPDPVLESECYVLRAQLALDRAEWLVEQGRPPVDPIIQTHLRQAEMYLGDWDRLNQFVENQYLHYSGQLIRKSLDAFTAKSVRSPYPSVPYTFEVFDDCDRKFAKVTIKERRDQFEQWMWESFLERHKEGLTRTQKAIAFGCTRDQLATVLKRLEKPRKARRKP